MIIVLLIVLFLASVTYAIFLPRIKGITGELEVAWRLKWLNKREYKVFNDVLIQTGNRSSQIDHIVVSIYGIFVIENKNYGGWIHGHEESEYWTQSFYRKKFEFRNPVLQTWGHVYTLKKVLADYDHIWYHPVVVFSGRARLKNVYSAVPVVYSRKLLRTIKRERHTIRLTTEQMEGVIKKLHEVSIRSKKAKKEHVRKAKKNRSEQKRKEDLLICPRCSGSLVVRQGKFGKFYGCANFPGCRYTKKYKKGNYLISLIYQLLNKRRVS